MGKEYSIFETVEDAVKSLKLDKRRRWFEFNGELVHNSKALVECSGCDGGGCSECGYRKRRYIHFPQYAIHNGMPVKIIFTSQLKTKSMQESLVLHQIIEKYGNGGNPELRVIPYVVDVTNKTKDVLIAPVFGVPIPEGIEMLMPGNIVTYEDLCTQIKINPFHVGLVLVELLSGNSYEFIRSLAGNVKSADPNGNVVVVPLTPLPVGGVDNMRYIDMVFALDCITRINFQIAPETMVRISIYPNGKTGKFITPVRSFKN